MKLAESEPATSLATASGDVTLRQALGTFATGVTVVSTVTSTGEPVGLTANSFNVLSLDPPLVLWSLRCSSACAEVFVAATYFTVNVLAEEQLEISRQFAQPVEDRFKGITWRYGPGAVPRLKGCAALFECRAISHQIAGDHVLFIGQVEEYRYQQRRPLIFHGGHYHWLGNVL